MNSIVKDPGSFRDPGSQVYSDREHVLRAVYPSSAVDYEAFRDSGLLDQLILEERLVPSEEVNAAANPGGQAAAYMLRHPRLPFISYAYEWPLGLLKKAALFHIDILLTALDRGFTLSDATAYNVQFVGTKPIFIDHLSFRPYREGEIWAAHRQFCMQFLNPIVLWSRFGIAPNAWFRGSLEGIEPEQLAPLLRWRDRLSPTMLSHIILQGMFQQRANSGKNRDIPARETRISKDSFTVMLSGLRSFIDRARMPQRRSAWDEYASDNSYSGAEAEAKHRFVRRMAASVKPGVVIDLGCNTGDYSIAALELERGRPSASISTSERLSRQSRGRTQIIFTSSPCGSMRRTPAPTRDGHKRSGKGLRSGSEATRCWPLLSFTILQSPGTFPCPWSSTGSCRSHPSE